MRRIVIAALAGAICYGVLYVFVSFALFTRCNGVPIHDFPRIFICWHYVHLWSASAFLIGLVVGVISPRWSPLTASVAVLLGLLLGSIAAATSWPFGQDNVFTIYGVSLYFVLPAAIGGLLGSLLQLRLWHAQA